MRPIVRRLAALTLCFTALAAQACSEDGSDGQAPGQFNFGDSSNGDAGTGGSDQTSAGSGGTNDAAGTGGMNDAAGTGGTNDAAGTGGTTDAAGAGGTSGDAGNDGGAGQASAGAGGSTDPDPPPTGEPTSGPLAGTLLRHNFVRQNVSPAASPAILDLVWSETIAASAQAYADKCVFEHSKGKYGENLYAGTAEPKGPGVVDSWASEVSDYDYASGKCSGVCGHYTQVVWRNSTELGCGYAKCTANSPFGSSKTWYNWVCQYNPPGNYVGQKPY
jgi:pathogenesis-related protein 1